ncbi:MAG: glycosyltransferase, partial [Acidobacteria bacterium]|nr:glycosyltransferase [Acidobacteriota bacterium]
RPYRFYKYLKKLGYPCLVITAAKQADGADPGIIHVPDECDAFWAGHIERPLTIQAHIERLIRMLILPGGTGIVWARSVAKVFRELVKQTGNGKVVLLSTFPPIGTHLAALQAARDKRICWIADFRDPFLSGSDLSGRSSVARWFCRRLEERMFHRADVVIANTGAIKAAWLRRYPFVKEKLRVLWNGFDPERRPKALPLPARSAKVMIHAGTLYSGRNANCLIAALRRLRLCHAAECEALRLVLVGIVAQNAGLDEASYDAAIREGWLEMPNSQVSRSEAELILSQADWLLLLQPQSQMQVPAKLFEYICIGRPILAVIPKDSAIEWILERSGIPYICLYPDDAPAEADRKLIRFLRFSSDPCEPSEWFLQNFDAERQTAQLCSIIEGNGDGF